MKLLHSILTILIFSFLAFFSISCGSSGSFPGPESEYVLGTICTVNLFEKGTPALYSQVFERLRELENILSANRDATDLDRINRNAGEEPVKVKPELIEVLEKALEYAEKSNGFFDPTIGPVVKLWGIGTERARIPDEDEIKNALALVNYHEVEINKEEGKVFLVRRGMILDLGAIAKGYAADELVKLLSREGIERAIIDLGGDIFTMGERKAAKRSGNDERLWRIGIQDPRESRGNILGIVTVKNKTVVTSGKYERFFEEGGKRYHHILSIKDGHPIENGLLSVTIVADNSMDADALSTSAFILGWEQGKNLIASVPGCGAIFVFEDLTVRLTNGLEKDFTLSAAEYHVTKQ